MCHFLFGKIGFCKISLHKYLPSLNEMMQPSMISNSLIQNNISKLRSSEVTSDTIWQIWKPWLNQIQKCRDETKFPFCYEPFQDSRQTEFGIKFNFSKFAKALSVNVYDFLKKLIKVPFWRKKLKQITT